jgi:formamidopyrimidine-DNA glycosylase
MPMPELPEVESIVNGLRGPLIGCTFTGVRVGWENIVARPMRLSSYGASGVSKYSQSSK